MTAKLVILRRRAVRLMRLSLAAALVGGCIVAPPGVVTPAAAPAAPTAVAAPGSAALPRKGGAGQSIVIRNNRGGNVMQMMGYRNELAASGRLVEIRGVCNSACTMLTTLPNACLGPGASIGFHAPRLPRTHIIPPMVDQIMASTYRNGVRERWLNEWRHSLKIQSISAQEYVRLDPETRLCPS